MASHPHLSPRRGRTQPVVAETAASGGPITWSRMGGLSARQDNRMEIYQIRVDAAPPFRAASQVGCDDMCAWAVRRSARIGLWTSDVRTYDGDM